ncbi:SDR family oxidoreductase [Candidatus Parcubacteria bacterium]|nr:SDR family oxidoreductase [Candidatus Parcubacteria bacterium]
MKEKVVLITGCSRGLGKFLAEKLSGVGFIVYAGVKGEDDVKALQKDWKDSFSNVFPLNIDITNDDSCGRAVKKIISKEKRLDVLINNAGITLVGLTQSFSVQDYLNILNINAVGAFRLIKEVIPQMKRQKFGRIINITSLNGSISLPNFGLYSSSKFALEGLSLAWRHELPEGIWITNIAPGAIAKGKNDQEKKLPHVPAREKFWAIKTLMPMVSQEKIAKTIVKVVEDSNPPARILLGNDAHITTLLHRFLPAKIWEVLLDFVTKK